MNNDIIKQIIEELGLDPGDEQLRQAVMQMMSARPEAEASPEFISELRRQLSQRAGDFTKSINNPAEQKEVLGGVSIINLFMKRTFAISLVAVLAVAAGGLWLLDRSGQPLLQVTNRGNDTELLSGKYAVTEMSANSFGALNAANLQAGGRGGDNAAVGSGSAEAPVASGEAQQKMIAPGTGGGILPYPGDNYTFTYKGDDLGALAANESVYRRIKPVQPQSLVERIVSAISLGLVNLNSFRSTNLQNFTIAEDREYGYMVNVDVGQGAVGIHQNWEKWPQVYNLCRDERCMAQYRIKQEEIPGDAEAIAIADTFLAEYGISKESYGQPVVQKQWLIAYNNTPDKANFYFPEQLQVVYPLVLEGKTVYDEGGSPHGLNVTVDIRSRRVSNVYELTTKQFERSDYAGEVDAKRIIGIAERGGFRNYPYAAPGSKNVVLELGTPSREMINMWYARDGRSGEQIYVPALVFPIINADGKNYWRQNVIVPLIKEVLDSDNQPPVRIMEDMPGSGPMPVEPDGGIGDTPNSSSTQSRVMIEPATRPTSSVNR